MSPTDETPYGGAGVRAILPYGEDFRHAVLWGIGQALTGRRRELLSDAERGRIADAIAEHLRLSGWRIEKGPPAAPHSPPSERNPGR